MEERVEQLEKRIDGISEIVRNIEIPETLTVENLMKYQRRFYKVKTNGLSMILDVDNVSAVSDIKYTNTGALFIIYTKYPIGNMNEFVVNVMKDGKEIKDDYQLKVKIEKLYNDLVNLFN